MKAYNNQRESKDNGLKKRETGFQLYLNGAHSARRQRPTSIRSKILFHENRLLKFF